MVDQLRIALYAFALVTLLIMTGLLYQSTPRRLAIYSSTAGGAHSEVPSVSEPRAALGPNNAAASDSETTLRQHADRMGLTLGSLLSQGPDWTRDMRLQETVGREFNTAVSVVYMKFAEPEQGQFKLGFMDKAKDIARRYNLKLFGQTLVYRASDTTPSWLHLDRPDCGGWPASELDRILREYIHTVVRYGGDSYSIWEVVNEPITPSHNGCWSKVLGQEEYIAKAFHYAREASPHGTLLLNDTFGPSGVDRSRTDEFFALVRNLKSRGVPIDAVGSEMHLDAEKLHANYMDELKYWLRQAREASVRAQITEIDVYQGSRPAIANPLENQKQIFYNVLRTCLQDSNCTGFITWGIPDKYSWRRNEQSKNAYHTDASPCLFDDEFGKKPAYYGVLQALQEGR